MVESNVIDILKACGALLEGHFLLSSGRHSDRYCQCARLLQYPDQAERVIAILKENLKIVKKLVLELNCIITMRTLVRVN